MTGLPAERWNFGALLAQGVARRVGNELSSEKLVLPFLYAALGGPILFAGLFAPVVIVARLVAQLLGARLIAMARRTRGFLSAGTGVSAVVLFLVAAFAANLPVVWLPAVFVAAAAVWGMSNGFGALTSQDMIGRVLSERPRVNLLFAIGAVSGAGVIVVTVVSQFLIGFDQAARSWDDQVHLMWASVAMLALSSAAALSVREAPRPARAALHEAYLPALRDGIRTVLRLGWFRRFMMARVLLLTVEMVMPFFAVHAANFHARTAPSLTVFVISMSLGMIGGGLVWPRVSRRSIQLVLSASALVAGLAALLAFVNHMVPGVQSLYTHAAMIFLLGFATQGALDGSTAYVVGSSNDEERPYCIAVANFAAGVVGIGLAIAVGSIAHERGTIWAIVTMGALNVVAAVYMTTLPAMPAKPAAGEAAPPA